MVSSGQLTRGTGPDANRAPKRAGPVTIALTNHRHSQGRADSMHGLLNVAGLGDNVKAILFFEQHPQPSPDNRVVVCDEDRRRRPGMAKIPPSLRIGNHRVC